MNSAIAAGSRVNEPTSKQTRRIAIPPAPGGGDKAYLFCKQLACYVRGCPLSRDILITIIHLGQHYPQ